MKNIIVGTAGHVDHGKTCLIKALTGTDTDRLKEEKKRGITIENGFADLTYGDYNISIIDVPGHEKFINNMLMGIGGIDMVLLVIGLDEGVMPQTVEHFNILTMLGITRGIIVYTKCDLVEDEEWIELVKDDARTLVRGSFMENAPEIEVSSYENLNIDKLKELIVDNIDDKLLKNDCSDLFRLFVDRVFTISGFGTVITGTLMEGSVKTGDEIYIYPECKAVKVRNIQVHNEQVDEAYAGQRTAINLGGIKKEEVERGSVLAARDSMEPGMMVDVVLKLFDDIDRVVLNNSRVHFYCGASQVLGKIVLLDCDSAGKGQTVYAQIRMEEPVSFRRNDRFIIRFYSPLITIGGGRILESSPVKHKRNDEKVINALKIKDVGTDKEVAELIISEKSHMLINLRYLALKMRIEPSTASEIVEKLIAEKKIRMVKNEYLMHMDYIKYVYDCALNILHEYHDNNKLSAGMAKEEFKSKVEKKINIKDRKVLDDLILQMIEDEIVKTDGKTVADFDFKISYSPEMNKMKERILNMYKAGRFEMPTVDEVISSEKDTANAGHIIDALELEGVIVRLSHQYYIDRDAFEWAFAQLKEVITKNGSITLAEFRDIIGTSRKYAMAILDYLDQQKITRKEEDIRVFY